MYYTVLYCSISIIQYYMYYTVLYVLYNIIYIIQYYMYYTVQYCIIVHIILHYTVLYVLYSIAAGHVVRYITDIVAVFNIYRELSSR